ncbi:MAG: hypothetical protein KGN84_09005 [Acidobacteriota bacterium]|nr:hypothetical protein [Acidobacteriota bacterium]
MSGKTLLIVGALTLSSIGIASAKSYDVVLGQNVKAGNTELKAGQYSVKVEGSQATFKDKSSSKSYTAQVTVVNSDKKFDQTTVLTNKSGDSVTVKEIDLGGSKTKLTFPNGTGSAGL